MYFCKERNMAQKPIRNKVHFGDNVNPLNDDGGVPSVNDDGNLQTIIDKVDKVAKFWQTGKADGDLVRYVPNVLLVTRQNLVAGVDSRQAHASETYTDTKNLEFTIVLAPNTYTNYATMEIVLPVSFVKKSNKTVQLDDKLMPVNNFFCRWFTEIDIKRYQDDMRILPTDKTLQIDDYANAQLKYLPDDAIKKLNKPFLYYNTEVYLPANTDRRPNNDNDDADRSDSNLTKRLNNLHDFCFQKNEYRIPLGLICDLGLCNFPIQTDTRIVITLERNMHKLLEDRKKRAAISTTAPDASIEFWDRPYIDYQEITLTAAWEAYLKTIQRNESALRMGVLTNPYQQTFEVAVGVQTISVDFLGASRQFDWLEISLVYDKSYAHETVYDSYDLELAANLIESIKFINASKAYTLTGKLLYDVNNKDEKFLLYKMFVAYQCNGCTFATLDEYKNNPVYQDMTDQYEYFGATKNNRIYIGMRRSKGNSDELEKITRNDSGLVVKIKLKAAATKKLQLRIVGYSKGEYWYAYTLQGYIMAYKNYNIAKADKF